MAPSENIYLFNGVFITETHRESLSLENVIWANTVLATGTLLGLVIYSGKETRMSMNSRSPTVKYGKLDQEINYMSFLLLIFMISMAAILTFFSSPPLDAILISTTYIRFLILMANIIPVSSHLSHFQISMRVNLEFAKLTYSVRINMDQEIAGTITRNSNIPESLGRIQYLLTDKTGTYYLLFIIYYS